MHIHKWTKWSIPKQEDYTEYVPINYDTDPEKMDREGREVKRTFQTRECEKCGEVQKRIVKPGYGG